MLAVEYDREMLDDAVEQISSDSPASETGAEYLVRQLAALEISHTFCVPGADTAVLVDALECSPDMRTVYATHEISAGAMADGFSRASGSPALALSAGGPGASYLAAAAPVARRDGSSVLFASGAPPGSGTAEPHGDGWPDDRAMFHATGAVCADISNTDEFDSALHTIAGALELGRTAYLRISLDAQRDVRDSGSSDAAASTAFGGSNFPGNTTTRFSGRVLLAVGARAVPYQTEIRKLSESFGLPVVTDMLARGISDEHENLALGHLGFMPSHGARSATSANHPLAADLIVALAADGNFKRRLRDGGIPLIMVSEPELKQWLQAAQVSASREACPNRTAWIRQFAKLPGARATPVNESQMGHDVIVNDACAALGPSAIHVIDAGQFHLIAPLRIVASQPRTILTGSELISMGWAIGASIGAKCAVPDAPVVAYVGDGSFLMHGLELTTAARYKVPVLFIVARNGVLGSILQGAGSNSGNSAVLGPADPAGIARACGVETLEIQNRDELQAALKDSTRLKKPRVLVVSVPELDNTAQDQVTGITWLDQKRKVRFERSTAVMS